MISGVRVPQGIVLGPILFLLFTNDLPSMINNSCKLFAHPNKCETIIITRKHKPHESSYTLEGLKKTNKAKYLGVNISSKLEWNPHIKTKVTKANKTLGFIKRNVTTRVSRTPLKL